MVFTAGQLGLGVLVQEQVLFRRLVDPDGDHGQALEVFLLALRRHAIVVLLGPFRVQLCAARNACAHFFSFLAPEYAAARRWYRRTTISRIRDNTIGPPAVPPAGCPRVARRALAW